MKSSDKRTTDTAIHVSEVRYNFCHLKYTVKNMQINKNPDLGIDAVI